MKKEGGKRGKGERQLVMAMDSFQVERSEVITQEVLGDFYKDD